MSTYTARTGTVRIKETQNPIEGIRVELWDKDGNYGLVYSTKTRVGGGFIVQVPDALETEFDSTNIPVFKIYSGVTLLKEIEDTTKDLINVSEDLFLDIEVATYDEKVNNNLPYEEKSGFALIQGVLTGANGGVLPDTTINVYERKFRDKILLISTKTDSNGQFETRLSVKDIINAKVVSTRQLRVEAVNDNSDIIAVASDIPLNNDVIAVALKAGDVIDQLPSVYNDDTVSELTRLVNSINYVTDSLDLATVGEGALDEHSDEVDYIAKNIGADYESVNNIVSTYKMAADIDAAQSGSPTPVDKNFMYAIVKGTSASINPALKYNGSQIKEIIKSAEKSQVIDAYLEYELVGAGSEQVTQPTSASEAAFDTAIDDFVAAIKVYQVEATKAIEIEEESYTLNDVLLSIFAADSTVNVQEEVDEFLTQYNNETNDTVDDFWTDYATVGTYTSSAIAEKAKIGLRLLGVTGMQKEVIEGIMSDIYAAPSPNIKDIALWDESTWVTKVTGICEAAEGGAGKLCVPKSIRGEETDHTSSEGIAAIASYAKTMKSLVQDAYAMTVMADKLDTNTSLITDATERGKAVTFLQNNPDLDLRVTNIRDIDFSNYDDTGVDTEELQSTLRGNLEPYQRLLRMVGGKPDAIETLKVDGYDSATAITQLSETAFVSAYSTILGGTTAAKAVYANANAIKTLITTNAINYTSGGPSVYVYPPSTIPQTTGAPDPAAHPDLATLFGSQTYCTCSHCSSLYSPSAYFVDILNFLKKNTASGLEAESVYDELARRRSDLIHIDITCKNANTALPYIDLVNEVLEKRILEDISGATPPNSFQTVGGTEELKSYPEHKVKDSSGDYVDYLDYKLIYDQSSPLKDSSAVYPNQLPFNLAQEESRTYLQHLGKSRYELMDLFRPIGATPTNGIDDYALVSEWLGLTTSETDNAADIITKEHTNSNSIWLFYGLSGATGVTVLDPINSGSNVSPSANWDSLLTSRVDVLLQQAQIKYNDLLELLSTDFLNPNGEITIVTNDIDVSEGTCDLSKLQLEFSGSATAADFLDKLHRFVRLVQASKKSIYELDTLFRLLAVITLDKDEFTLLGKVMQLSEKLNIRTELLACGWTSIDTHVYSKYGSNDPKVIPSVYEQVFLNRAVINQPNTDFEDYTTLPSEYIDTTNNIDRIPFIATVARIEEQEVKDILSYFNIATTSAITLLMLSRIVVMGALSRSLNVDISTLLLLFNSVGVSTTIKTNYSLSSDSQIFDAFELLADIVAQVENSVFDFDDIKYLTLNIDEEKKYYATDNDIQTFYENLRTELQKYADVDGREEKQKNAVTQLFSEEFSLPADVTNELLLDLEVTGASSIVFMDNLISEEFTSSTIDTKPLTKTQTLATLVISEFYEHYFFLQKVATIATKVNITPEVLRALYTTPSLIGFDFSTIPVSDPDSIVQSVANDTLYNLLRLDKWYRVSERLKLSSEELIDLITQGTNGNESAWLAILEERKGWGSKITDLMSASILNVTFATNLSSDNDNAPKLLERITDVISWCDRIALSPLTIYDVLKSDLNTDASEKILLAAKGKQEIDQWLAIAPPLRNEIRRKQRDALVAYLLANPKSSNYEYWRNKNELFEYFLIDTEMEPCALTSRIKQGINSIQTYINRVLMGLEYEDNLYGVANRKLKMSGDLPQEWAKWRKWYRVWEANRKVFLYPENWIEPELRDNKTDFFKELETELQQDDLTQGLAEDALSNYLEKMDEVGRLEPAGCCEDNEGVIHVFGRTYGHPNKYFYRRLEGDVWTPWERVEMDIKSEHVMPIVWNRRLHLFWLTFRETQEKFYVGYDGPGYWNNKEDFANRTSFNASNWFYNDDFHASPTKNIHNKFNRTGYDDTFQTTIHITTNWAEYKDGSWQKPKVAKEDLKVKVTPSVDNYIAQEIESYKKSSSYERGAFLNLITNGKVISGVDLIKSRMSLFPYIHNPETDNVLNLWIMHPSTFYNADDTLLQIVGYQFKDSGAEPCPFYGNYEWSYSAPNYTFIKNMKYVENELQLDAQGYVLDKPLCEGDLIKSPPPYDGGRYTNRYAYHLGYTKHWDIRTINGFSKPILKATNNGLYKITSKSNFGDRPLENQFFFEDDVNTFFVRKVVPDYNVVTATAGVGGIFTGGVLNGSTTTAIAGVGNATSLLTSNSGTNLQSAIQLSSIYYPSTINATSASTQANAGPIGVATATSTSSTTPVINVFAPTSAYYFQTFYHSHIHEFKKALNKDGIDGLMKLEVQTSTNTMKFDENYDPNDQLVANIGKYLHPTNKIDFDYTGAYSIYNWELFFHSPMLIAQRLSDNQRFEEAQKWFHYIFNPTANTDDVGQPSTDVQRFWRFRPFYEKAGEPIETLADILTAIGNNSASALQQIEVWENDPFKPHAIARLRTLAYMKTVVMKYIDNLIAWADQLFRRDTIESVNEATNLYILASNILGKQPESVPARATTAKQSFDELGTDLDSLSNALKALESYVGPHAAKNKSGVTTTNNVPEIAYFCVPANPQLLGYWDKVADRLFKIRNCMNIEGQTRSLPLYEPPIDPALLVKAAAAGIDINSVLDDINESASNYRFSYIVQKANEFCGDVKALGASLLSALEKRDAEHLAALRANQEIALLDKVRLVKETQVQEAEANMVALAESKKIIQSRFDYYSSRPYMNNKEKEAMRLTKVGNTLQTISSYLATSGGGLKLVPQFHAQAISAVGASFGGLQIGGSLKEIGTSLGIVGSVFQAKARNAATIAGYERRMDDWQFQAKAAEKELAQIDKQLIAAEIRIAITQKELDSHDQQVAHATEVEEYMRTKFTNKQLYNWMVSQISATYFQSYQLAFDMAKRAERCYDYELPYGKKVTGGYIKFGYWDSLKKGLLSGEKLQLDIRKLEVAYIENNKREFELTKHISLALTDPEALIQLKQNGSSYISLYEELFDLDYPGHYYRRIKSVSISIPCVSGPYTTINATLSLEKSAIRKVANISETLTLDTGSIMSIATSGAQNDSGLFELNFNDARYLPFEGRGAISEWKLELAAEDQIRLFDFDTISDVIMHVKYTSQDGGDMYKPTVISALNSVIDGSVPAAYVSDDAVFADVTKKNLELPRYFSLKHEFANDWNKYTDGNTLEMPISDKLFPFFAKGKTVTITSMVCMLKFKDADESASYRVIDTTVVSGTTALDVELDSATPPAISYLGSDGTVSFTINEETSRNMKLKVQKDVSSVWTDVTDIDSILEDIYLVAYYTI